MCYVHRLQGRLIPYSNTDQVQEIPMFSRSKSILPIQSTTISSVHSTNGVVCQELGWRVNMEKSELDPKQVFNFVDYQFDLKEGKVRPSLEHWQTLNAKIQKLLSQMNSPVRKLMSLIWRLTATEKPVDLGGHHMRPIQWHFKNNWSVSESLEKVIPIPRSLHTHLKWWFQEENVLQGQPLHPLSHALQIRCIKRRVGCSLSGTHCKGNLVHTRKQVANKLSGTKDNLSVSKRVPRPLLSKIILAYINKAGGMRSVQLCACGESKPSRVVSSSRGFQVNMQQEVPTSDRPICYEVQQQTGSFCVTNTRPPGLGNPCTQPVLGKS